VQCGWGKEHVGGGATAFVELLEEQPLASSTDKLAKTHVMERL